jgi:hypothetical protein
VALWEPARKSGQDDVIVVFVDEVFMVAGMR